MLRLKNLFLDQFQAKNGENEAYQSSHQHLLNILQIEVRWKCTVKLNEFVDVRMRDEKWNADYKMVLSTSDIVDVGTQAGSGSGGAVVSYQIWAPVPTQATGYSISVCFSFQQTDLQPVRK